MSAATAGAAGAALPAQGSGPVGVGVIGAGVISGAYLQTMTSFSDLQVHAIADQNARAAAERAEEYAIPTHGDVEAVLNHPEVEIVVNLTTPAAHVAVGQAAIAAGKHVWNEKPLALDVNAGKSLLDQAAAAGLRVGCAPDTVLGTGLQTARRIIERGDIGTPLTALALMQNPGPDLWHPNPAFLFGEGAGPLFDIGPYYLTTLIQIFGSVATVAALASTARTERVIGSGPNAGQTFEVTADTHTGALIGFASGASAQAVFSFDSPAPRTGFVEIAGSEATIALPDPNQFDGQIRLWRTGSDEWEAIDSTGPAYGRGLGVLEMARAIRSGTGHRASGDLALHVLEVMASITSSARTTSFVSIGSRAPEVPVLDDGFDPARPTLGAA
ncbi:Gfo/Idh/MocA family protein [Pseudactinotalea sp. Z1748]|uniref:Gfo/Idh/MocA family protein n=1 Tax=Pseudactinotalea sp. Z1748 TaxID=3413027 RepID=UPI003C7C1B6F